MQIYRFGDFELDLDSFELRLNGEPVKLERRAFDLLALLIRHADRLVPREELICALWPPAVVIDFDSGLNTLVRKVRGALGDLPDSPNYIETVPGRGYRFIAPVVTVTNPPPARPVGATIERPSRRLRWPLATASLLLLVASAALVAWFTMDARTGPTRIAVLPFENLTGNDQLAYLASGLAEDTSTSLGKIDVENLRVIGVGSPGMSGTVLPVSEVGSKLGVDFVVRSSLRLDRARIRVTSRLLRVGDGEQIWSASIDRELTNVLGVQRELSTAIAEQVRLQLSPEVAAAIDRRQTQNPAAYALYLKGRYEWSKLTPASTQRAIEHLEQATTEDATYALAWAGLAFTAITSMRTADVAPNVALPKARKALEQAVKLGPDLAETRYAQGYFSLFHDLDMRAAEKAARSAIDADPNNSQAHMLLGVSLMRVQPVEGREMMRRARELDPMFALAFANSANVALSSGDVSGGMEFAKQTIAIDPQFWLGHYYLGRAQLALGQLDAALQAFTDAARLSDGHSLTYSARAELLVRLGRLDEARALLGDAEARAARQYVPPYTLAAIHAELGNLDAAFGWLERAVTANDLNLLNLASDARMRSVRDDPRFEALARRCGCVEATKPPR
jgi:TolB-like protein/DNA-binding winged helix-turn-helix (wHTH) protein/Flp pilus assembly protein TadD